MGSGEARLGEVVANRYAIESIIGQGGQSTVYAATDRVTQHAVALKIAKDEGKKDPNQEQRLTRESHAMISLDGTAALKVFDQCLTQDGAMCLVMERLYGVDLDDYLNERTRRGDLVQARELVELLGPVVNTLQVAHQQDIVHRDLKPENIFVLDTPTEQASADSQARVRLLDFGFAKFHRLRSFTAVGTIAGSPRYIAPEGWRGERNPSARFDVYSFGAIIFRALGGHPPFPSHDLVSLLRDVTKAERPSLLKLRPDLPPATDAWVKQALAINPDDRFQNMQALWNAFKIATGY